MKRFVFILLLALVLQSCYIYRPCPIKACRVDMEHRHGSKDFSPRKFYKAKIHFIGEKYLNEGKKKRKLERDRRRMER